MHYFTTSTTAQTYCSCQANLHFLQLNILWYRMHEQTRTLPVKSMPLPMVMAEEDVAAGLPAAAVTEGVLHVTVDDHENARCIANQRDQQAAHQESQAQQS